MSLTNPRANSPIKRRYQWSGSTGSFKYYDGTSNQFTNTLKFIILDQKSGVVGFDDQKQKGIYSSLVNDISTELITVKCDGKTLDTGTYKDVKSNNPALKYMRAVFAYDVETGDIIQINFSGSAIGPWIESGVQEDGKTIVLTKNPEQQKKGATVYYVPHIGVIESDETSLTNAKNADLNLQNYWAGVVVEPVAHEPVEVETGDVTDDLPF